MVDLIDAILKGVNLTSFFHSRYYGSIKFRPITMHEVNDVFMKTLVGHSVEAVKFATMFRFEKKEEGVETVDILMEINEIRRDMNKWIVFHATKDFQPDHYRMEKEGVPIAIHAFEHEECYLEIEEFAKDVLDLSCAPKESVRSVLETASGEIIGTAMWRMDYHLIEEIGDLTDVQLSFIVESYNVYTGEQDVEKSDLKSYMNKIGFKPTITDMTDEQRDIISKLGVMKNELKPSGRVD